MPALIPLDNTLGALFIGVFLSSILYGVNCLQVYSYFTEHTSHDGKYMKAFVTILTVIDTFHAALLAIFFYHYSVTEFGDYIALVKDMWALSAQIVVGGFVGLLIQGFFAYRIHNLSGGRFVIPILICLLGSAKLALGTTFAVKSFRSKLFSDVRLEVPYGTAAFSSDIACDVLVTSSMIFYLRKNRTHLRRTNKAIDLLVTYAINTCESSYNVKSFPSSPSITLVVQGVNHPHTAPSISSATCLILFIKTTNTLIYAPVYFIVVRCYSGSFMSTLNSRDNVREVLDAQGGVLTLPDFGTSQPVTDNTDDSASRGRSDIRFDVLDAFSVQDQNRSKKGGV